MLENKKIRELYTIYTQLLFSNMSFFLGSNNFLVSFPKGKKIFVHQPYYYYFLWLIFFKTSLFLISLAFLFNLAAYLSLKFISFRFLSTHQSFSNK